MSDHMDIVQTEIPAEVRKMIDSISHTSRLILTIDASHAGVVNLNDRLYRPPQVERGAFTMIDRPFLKHHDDYSDPIGVVVDAEYHDIATDEFKSAHPDYMRPDFWTDEIPWEDVFGMCPKGVGKLVAQAQVTDEDAQTKILDRRFLRVSIKFRTDRMDCGCGKPKIDYWAYEGDEDEEDDRFCSEIPGTRDKDGVLHFNMPNRLVFPHLSVVNEPADENAKIIESQFIDMKVWDRNRVVEPTKTVRSLPTGRRDDADDESTWIPSANLLAEYIHAAYRGGDLPATSDEIRRSFPKVDLPAIARDMGADSQTRPATDSDLLQAVRADSFTRTYIVELDGTHGSKHDAVKQVCHRLSDLLPQDGVAGDGDTAPNRPPADDPSEETPMTREELLKDPTVKDLLAEAETRGKDSRDEEVADLTRKLTAADEAKQATETALEETKTELSTLTDKVAGDEKRSLVDKLITIRVALGDAEAKDNPEAATETLMARTTESLRDAIADEEKRVPAPDEEDDNQDTVDDPGQPINGGDAKDKGESGTIMGSFLESFRSSV